MQLSKNTTHFISLSMVTLLREIHSSHPFSSLSSNALSIHRLSQLLPLVTPFTSVSHVTNDNHNKSLCYEMDWLPHIILLIHWRTTFIFWRAGCSDDRHASWNPI